MFLRLVLWHEFNPLESRVTGRLCPASIGFVPGCAQLGIQKDLLKKREAIPICIELFGQLAGAAQPL